MSENVADTARRLGLKGQEGVKQVRRLIRRLLDRHNAAAQLFLGDDGNSSPKRGAKWLRAARRRQLRQ
jgi:hypothetical protein